MQNIDKKEKAPTKIILGLTQGDYNGIGYEIMLKSFKDHRIFEFFTPLIYGSNKTAMFHKKALELNDVNINPIRNKNQIANNKLNIIDVSNEDVKVEFGLSKLEAGKHAVYALDAAVEDIKNNVIHAIVTAPINKKNVQSEKFNFHGHTEYLAGKFNVENFLMMMVADKLRIGFVTGHEPIREVSALLTQERIFNKIKIMHNSLVRDFGKKRPKIAVLGLNPHTGDDGLIGDEEKTTIIPAIEQAFNKGIYAFGPFSADGLFGSTNYMEYDGVLAMYHDQGMIAFKSKSFDSGVNYTAGLPIVRTSPAHGTAYDIAGKKLASPNSFKEAMYLAVEIFKHRMAYVELNKNPLKTVNPENLDVKNIKSRNNNA